MTPEPSSFLPHVRSPGRSGATPPLEGEVIPPSVRVFQPDAAASTPSGKARAPFRLSLGTALLAGALVATLSGAGALEGYRWHLAQRHATPPGPNAMAAALAHLGKEMGDLKLAMASSAQPDLSALALEKSIDQLRVELDHLRSVDAAAVAQVAARLDGKAMATPAPVTSDIVARLDALDHDPRLADITSRLDRMEHQVSSSIPTGSIVPQARAANGESRAIGSSAAQSARPVKPPVLDNWIVRDVYSGIALVEGRTGSVREVVPGETLPGAGEVRSIQRRGRGWIVVTSRGVIDPEAW